MAELEYALTWRLYIGASLKPYEPILREADIPGYTVYSGWGGFKDVAGFPHTEIASVVEVVGITMPVALELAEALRVRYQQDEVLVTQKIEYVTHVRGGG